MSVIRRILAYSRKVYDLDEIVAQVSDCRIDPRIPTSKIFSDSLVMALCQLGSLNGLEQSRWDGSWKRWSQGPPASADTMGRVFALTDPDKVRRGIQQIYSKMKRNKALRGVQELPEGWTALILDGHENMSSYLRCCPDCLQRVVHTEAGDKTQYYHRIVTSMLVCEGFQVYLDVEPQRPGEDEVAAALRLLRRVQENYPRAFDLVVCDGLYLRADFYQAVLGYGKGMIAVLKDEKRDLFQDAMSLFEDVPAKVLTTGRTTRRCWDIEGFTTWPQLGKPVRVVRSLERSSVTRQITGEVETRTSDWIWAVVMPEGMPLSMETVLYFGHNRWRIENNGYHEIVHCWHADHVYKHDGNAMVCFWLLLMLAYNLFHAFYRLNLKPALRCHHTVLYWMHRLAADFHASFLVSPAPT